MKKQEKENREDEILRAAANVFFKKGYRATKMSDIAKEANLSKGLTYFYFKNKDELYFAVMNMALEQNYQFAKVAKEMFKDKAAGEILPSMVKGYMSFIEEVPAVTNAIVNLLALKHNKSNDKSSSAETSFESEYYKNIQISISKVLGIIQDTIDEIQKDDGIKNKLPSAELFWLGFSLLVGQQITSKTMARVRMDEDFKDYHHLFVDPKRFSKLILDVVRSYLDKPMDKNSELSHK